MHSSFTSKVEQLPTQTISLPAIPTSGQALNFELLNILSSKQVFFNRLNLILQMLHCQFKILTIG